MDVMSNIGKTLALGKIGEDPEIAMHQDKTCEINYREHVSINTTTVFFWHFETK